MTSIKILFVLDKIKANRLGLAPLRCRITYLGERKPFATGLFVNPKHWDSKSQLAKPPNEDNNFINAELSLIKNKINQAFLFLQVQGVEFDVKTSTISIKENPSKNNWELFSFTLVT